MQRLLAVGAVGALCAIALVGYVLSWPQGIDYEEVFAEKPYYVSPPHAISKSPKLVSTAIASRIEQGDNVRLLLGSSELDLVEPLSAHPYHFFNENNYSIDTISIGSAGFQCLFHAMEVGALDSFESIPDRKVALIVSMQWFYGDGCTSAAFLKSFSWEMYEAFMSNEKLSQETKTALKERAYQLGVDKADLDAASGQGTVEETINYTIGRFIDEKQKLDDLDASLNGLLEPNDSKTIESSNPDWENWMESALRDAQSDCTTNDWGIYDNYWEKYTLPWLEEYNSEDYATSFRSWNNKEVEDLLFFFQVCKELDIEPMIIMMPVKGVYYDLTQYPAESRADYYELIRDTCAENGVRYADYSDHEYDKDFMHDIMHLGSLGWVYVNHDLMAFFLGDDAVEELPAIEIEQVNRDVNFSMPTISAE